MNEEKGIKDVVIPLIAVGIVVFMAIQFNIKVVKPLVQCAKEIQAEEDRITLMGSYEREIYLRNKEIKEEIEKRKRAAIRLGIKKE